jgi:hypothetical protein
VGAVNCTVFALRLFIAFFSGFFESPAVSPSIAADNYPRMLVKTRMEPHVNTHINISMLVQTRQAFCWSLNVLGWEITCRLISLC